MNKHYGRHLEEVVLALNGLTTMDAVAIYLLAYDLGYAEYGEGFTGYEVADYIFNTYAGGK